MRTKTNINAASRVVHAYSFIVPLGKNLQTTVRVVRYKRSVAEPKIVLFDTEINLLEWCSNQGYREAINGGFFLRNSGLPLGDAWEDGRQRPYEPFSQGWDGRRGSIYISPEHDLHIAPRHILPKKIDGSLLEIGPTLVHRGISMFLESDDPEGFSETAAQHDEDINCKRHPRAAIGLNDEYIWTVIAEGRSPRDAGMFLNELSEVFISLGATEAVNLDGGRSSTQISGGKLMNFPRTNFDQSPTGYPVRNAIVFEVTKR